jgi:hypothetical protein
MSQLGLIFPLAQASPLPEGLSLALEVSGTATHLRPLGDAELGTVDSLALYTFPD